MLGINSLREGLTQLGATKVAHRDGTLLDHLENTYLILRNLDCPEHVCLAGLFHGAYGTQALHSEKIEHVTDVRRGEVQALIGEKAERLVFEFSVMTYESLGKSFRNVLKPDGNPVLRDRRTGQIMPMTRAEFDELLYVKLADVIAYIPTRRTETQLDMSSDYGAFWHLVAEYLGPSAIVAWNRATGETEWSQLNK
jgi:hypothetical protein